MNEFSVVLLVLAAVALDAKETSKESDVAAFFSRTKATSIVSMCLTVTCDAEQPLPYQEICWEVQI